MTARRDTEEYRGRFLLVAAGNWERTGGGAMCLSPGADPADGSLDVTIARHLSRLGLLRYFLYLARGTHPGKPGVEFFRCSEIQVDCAIPVEVQADGEWMSLSISRKARAVKSP